MAAALCRCERARKRAAAAARQQRIHERANGSFRIREATAGVYHVVCSPPLFFVRHLRVAGVA